MQNMPIAIFRGDDTDALGYQTIVGTIRTDLDLTGCKAVFKYLSFSVEFNPIPEDKKLTVIIPASETSKFPPGLGYASLRVYDSEGKLCTFSNRIMVFVATKTPMFGNAEFEVDFNVRPELEPLKIFVGPNPDDFDEYRGFLEKVIDRASAEKYGLAILLDAIDSDLGANDGVAATPVAVKAAYAAIIEKLTDDYYTKDETDEAIDRVAAYYITYDAAGHPFPTHAALANAQTVYSGGTVRVPTRNDYAIVLADETQGGSEYRYIYAVAEGQTTGSWQPQYPVEGVMTVDQTVQRNSQNPVASSGIWSAIWGALAALPAGFTSLYDWCAAQLAGKISANATGADIAVSGTDPTKISAALAGKADDADVTLKEKWTLAFSLTSEQKEAFSQTPGASDNNYALTISPSPGVGSYRLYVGSYDAAILIRYPRDSTNLILMNGDARLGLQQDDLVATLSGYQLGSQSDKPLASEAEAEALRNGKQDALSSAQLANIDAVQNKRDYADLSYTFTLEDYPQNIFVVSNANLTDIVGEYTYTTPQQAQVPGVGWYKNATARVLWFVLNGSTISAMGPSTVELDASLVEQDVAMPIGDPSSPTGYLRFHLLRRVPNDSLALNSVKANRVTNPTEGNLAALDANGNPVDSGYHFEVRNGIPCIVQYT